MRKLYILPLLVLLFGLYSCEDIIQMDLPEGDKLIIINGVVSDTVPVWAEVLQTANYNDNGPVPVIVGAIVRLFENDIFVSELSLDSVNVYTSDFVGTPGNIYYLQVAIPPSHPELGGTVWRSDDELMMATAPIDSFYQKFVPKNVFQDEGIYVFYHFNDPAGIANNYRIRVWQNDTVGDGAGDITVFEDIFFDGRKFDDNDLSALQINGIPAPVDKTFKVEHSGISKAYLDYLALVQEQTVQVGGLFDPPPALLKGNIKGITNPENLALGFFAATGLNFGEYIVVE